ncbi:MAG: hypothetical protein GKR92_02195 [Gammaproteobacteria bacterium]|nr:MAG: hypothetical protein GKR92_02195 [Gammaproteobacteria bacterium]
MPIYKVKHHSLDACSAKAIRSILAERRYIVDEFLKQIETYIEDYHAVVKSSLDIPQAKLTADQLDTTSEDINKVLHDLHTLPTFGIPLLKAKASFSGLGYLPEILDRTRTDLMHVRDIITWATDNIRGETNQDALHRLKILITNIAKLYKTKFDRPLLTNEKSEFMQIMHIVFIEIDETFSTNMIQREVDSLQEEDLSTRY